MTDKQTLVEKLKSGGLTSQQDAQDGAIAQIPFGFEDSAGFALMQRAAQLLAASTLVPQQFRGNIADCVIAIEMARRLGASPLAVMQNMYIVYGRPAWSSQFVIACLNASGRFSPLRFEMRGAGPTRSCIAWVIDKTTGDRLEGAEVSIEMAKKEGWYDRKSKDGSPASKWPTMPELMLRYRAASFFGRLYAPDIMMGMQTREELDDHAVEHDFTETDLVHKIRAANPQTQNWPHHSDNGAWTDSKGAIFNAHAHGWNAVTNKPSVTEAGVFRSRRTRAPGSSATADSSGKAPERSDHTPSPDSGPTDVEVEEFYRDMENLQPKPGMSME